MRVLRHEEGDGCVSLKSTGEPGVLRFKVFGSNVKIGDVIFLKRKSGDGAWQITELDEHAPSVYGTVPEYKCYSGICKGVVRYRLITKEMNQAFKDAGFPELENPIYTYRQHGPSAV